MKKYFETYNGIEYPIREVDLSPILEGYGVERIADSNLSKAISQRYWQRVQRISQ